LTAIDGCQQNGRSSDHGGSERYHHRLLTLTPCNHCPLDAIGISILAAHFPGDTNFVRRDEVPVTAWVILMIGWTNAHLSRHHCAGGYQMALVQRLLRLGHGRTLSQQA
jgi:hypothetical protein